MRPVAKGTAPRAYARYEDAIEDLRTVIGDFCSYCERQIETHLAVEHIQPKSRRKSLRTSWDNFLLGCVNCNSCKGKKKVLLDKHLWPDRDNTLRAFIYEASGRVRVSPQLTKANRDRAKATLALVGLDRIPGNPIAGKRPTSADGRWRRRQEAFGLAQRQLARLQQQDTTIIRDLIADVAHGRGMFSVWMHVFAGDADMRQRLVQRFIGTADNCFDPVTGAAIHRPGGMV